MADEKHLRRLKEGVGAWNTWRKSSGPHRLDLRGVDLSGVDLSGADLSDVNLSDVNLSGAKLCDADLSGADLRRANLRDAILNIAIFWNDAGQRCEDLRYLLLSDPLVPSEDLPGADLPGADLSNADLSNAELSDANLAHARLRSANLTGAYLTGADLVGADLTDANVSNANLAEAAFGETVFGNVDLTGVIGLETCHHAGPSIIDHRTLQRSGPLPLAFLRGVGLSDRFIDYLPLAFDQAIPYFIPCFISYSNKDKVFAERLHADLQNMGVRCWFAPHDLPIGAKILDGIDAAIRVRDKVVLILSKNSIESDWVEDEVKTAFEEERKRKQTVLFPIRLDNEVMETAEAWAAKLEGGSQHRRFPASEGSRRLQKDL